MQAGVPLSSRSGPPSLSHLGVSAMCCQNAPVLILSAGQRWNMIGLMERLLDIIITRSQEFDMLIQPGLVMPMQITGQDQQSTAVMITSSLPDEAQQQSRFHHLPACLFTVSTITCHSLRHNPCCSERSCGFQLEASTPKFISIHAIVDTVLWALEVKQIRLLVIYRNCESP